MDEDCFSDSGILDRTTLMREWDLSSIEQFMTQDTWEQTPSATSYTNNSNVMRPNANSSSSMDSSQTSYPITHGWNSSCTTKQEQTTEPDARPRQVLFSFCNSDSLCNHSHLENNVERGGLEPMDHKGLGSGCNSIVPGSKRTGKKLVRPYSQNHEHMIAERKRREIITQKVIELSAVIPGLKKVDKASILEGATKYVKQLEEMVKTLQAQVEKTAMELELLVKKTQLSVVGNNSYSNESTESCSYEQSFPEVRIKLSEKTFIVKIHCKNHKGIVVKALCQMENLNLKVMNMSVMPFADSFLDITATTEIEEGFSMTEKELMKKLLSAIK